VLDCQIGDSRAVLAKKGTGLHQEHLRSARGNSLKRRIKIVGWIFQSQGADLQTQRFRPTIRRLELVGRDCIPEHGQSGLIGKCLGKQFDLLFGQFRLA
jgi:hypothetical protein